MPADFTASVPRFKDGHLRECWRDHVHSQCIDAGCWQLQRPGEIHKVHRDWIQESDWVDPILKDALSGKRKPPYRREGHPE